MMELRAYDGTSFLIDDEDYDLVSKYKWYIHTNTYKNKKRITLIAYSRRNGKKTTIKLHRLILGLTDPSVLCDHINGNTLDNRRSNLRPCTPGQNMFNQRKQSNTKFKYKGVAYASKNKVRAEIYFQGTRTIIGYYYTQEQAALAYNEKAKELFGEFANLNEVIVDAI